MSESTPDHYQVLGVARDATPEEIKAAFRKKASIYHPDKADAEDDPEDRAAMMARINAANAVLSDPERRARYDETGHDAKLDLEAKAQSTLASMFSQAIGSTPEDADVVLAVAAELTRRAMDAQTEIDKARHFIAKLTRRRDRVRRKTEGQPNLVQSLIDARIRSLHASIPQNEQVLAVVGAAQLALADYEFVPPPATPGWDADPDSVVLSGLMRLGSKRRDEGGPFNFFTRG